MRRRQRKRRAREALERALAIFERLGAAVYAERARSELARIGGRAVAAGDGLSETERRIADLVAEGRSNKEVAAALSLSPKTVEWNLSKVYAKLGVRSRTELARRLPLTQIRGSPRLLGPSPALLASAPMRARTTMSGVADVPTFMVERYLPGVAPTRSRTPRGARPPQAAAMTRAGSPGPLPRLGLRPRRGVQLLLLRGPRRRRRARGEPPRRRPFWRVVRAVFVER